MPGIYGWSCTGVLLPDSSTASFIPCTPPWENSYRVRTFICSRISRNTGIFYRLRHYLSPLQLRQLYYNLIYPYVLYAITAWGSTYKSHLKVFQTKQNHIVRIVFFSNLYGVLNLLDLLTVDNIYKHQTLKFIHNWHKHQLPSIFDKYFKYVKNVHSYMTRYASNDNLYQSRARTNPGKQGP